MPTDLYKQVASENKVNWVRKKNGWKYIGSLRIYLCWFWKFRLSTFKPPNEFNILTAALVF